MVLARISVWLIPLLLAGTALYALWRRVDVFSDVLRRKESKQRKAL